MGFIIHPGDTSGAWQVGVVQEQSVEPKKTMTALSLNWYLQPAGASSPTPSQTTTLVLKRRWTVFSVHRSVRTHTVQFHPLLLWLRVSKCLCHNFHLLWLAINSAESAVQSFILLYRPASSLGLGFRLIHRFQDHLNHFCPKLKSRKRMAKNTLNLCQIQCHMVLSNDLWTNHMFRWFHSAKHLFFWDWRTLWGKWQE